MKQPRQARGLLRSKVIRPPPDRVQSSDPLATTIPVPSRVDRYCSSVQRILLITNAAAGGSDQQAVDAALEVLRQHADVQIAATSDQAEVGDVLAKRAGRDVVVAGGDGSLHAVVAALHRSNDLTGPILGLIPLGT